MAPLFLEFAADRGEVATDAPELRASDRASLDAFREGAIDGRKTARDSLHFRMGSRPGFLSRLRHGRGKWEHAPSAVGGLRLTARPTRAQRPGSRSRSHEMGGRAPHGVR